jgi:glycosyltransferase involved in cell wall biosynthesis
VKGYDIIVGCGLLPAFLQKAKIVLNIFAPYGGDLYIAMPTYVLRRLAKSIPSLVLNMIIMAYQRRAIKKAKMVISGGFSTFWWNAMKSIGVTEKNIQMSIPIVYSPSLNQENQTPNHFSSNCSRLRNLKAERQVLIINHSRQIWTESSKKEERKGNNILISGFAQFQAKGGKGSLFLFEYGPDIDESKQLINNLRIEDNVIWLPKLPRIELLSMIEISDFVADQFISGGIGGTGWEGMAMGKPVFSYLKGDDKDFRKLHFNKPIPPIINVKTSEEIAAHLIAFEKDPKPYQMTGAKARSWFESYMGKGLAEKWAYVLSCIEENKRIDVESLKFS